MFELPIREGFKTVYLAKLKLDRKGITITKNIVEYKTQYFPPKVA